MGNKLELTWYGKEDKLNIEPRLLIENPELSNTVYDSDTENMLIHGDNLLALKALEANYRGKVKQIYADPPYNTGSAFEYYDDNVEHSIWLSLMKSRLEIMKNLLTEDGSIWLSIDADESHYLKVLCDEVFGRNNFVDEIVWQRAYSPINLKKTLSRSHDTILVYARKKSQEFRFNGLPRSEEANKRYKNPDNDPRGAWKAADSTVGPAVQEKIYPITLPSGRVVEPSPGRCWLYTKDRFQEMIDDNRIWFGKDGNNVPSVKKFANEVKNEIVSTTWWTREEVGDNQEAKREVKALDFSGSPFDTPKPERLIERIFTIGSNEGDLVLDAFLGSGTTSAVAHKMNRRWIGIEMGDTAYSYCKPRMDMIINGTEKGGITKSAKWVSGGGYRFFELAPSLIVKDEFDQLVINEEYNADMLAATVALHEGFVYSPDNKCFWKQSRSNENAYLYVTTQTVTNSLLSVIKKDLKDDEFLLIACTSYQSSLEKAYNNIVIKKIPQMLLDNCEFGKDNYNLNIINPPVYEEEDYE